MQTNNLNSPSEASGDKGLSLDTLSQEWGVSERTLRNYRKAAERVFGKSIARGGVTTDDLLILKEVRDRPGTLDEWVHQKLAELGKDSPAETINSAIRSAEEEVFGRADDELAQVESEGAAEGVELARRRTAAKAVAFLREDARCRDQFRALISRSSALSAASLSGVPLLEESD